MAFLGADTDELREVGQQFQEGKETTDQVITYLKALIAILRAASVFTGGASAAYATYLETVVVPWLERISMALGMFAQVLGAQAEAQDTASDPSTIDYGSLPSYAPQGQNPAPITPYEGPPVTGNPGGQGVPTPTDAGATSSGPGLTIGDNGHLMIDTGIDLDGPDGAATGGGQTGAPIGTSGIGSAATAGPSSTGPADFGRGGIDSGMGDLGGGSGGGSGGGTGGGGGGPAPGLGGGGSVDGGSAFDGSTNGGAGSPFAHNGGLSDGGMGGTTPGSEALGATGMGDATPAASESNGPSYGAAAGIAGGAAALGLGGAALAARGGGTGTGTPAGNEIDRLATGNGRGSSGAEVTELQQRLTEAGYDTQGVDGKWGPDTQAAYDAYRGDNPLPVQAGQGYSSPSGYDYNQITGVRGNSHVTPEFLREVEGMSQRLGARPEHILAAMSFETGGSFDPAQPNNAGGSATGLIQFMPDTARGLGTSTAELARMTPTEQLQYVEKYFEPYRGRLGDLESVYTSILSGSPHSGDEALFTQGTRAYSANSALDVNHNGVITAAEATQHVRARMGSGAGN